MGRPATQHWHHQGPTWGEIQYLDMGHTLVAAGAPHAGVAWHGHLCRSFIEHAEALGKAACFFAVEPYLVQQLQLLGQRCEAVKIGEQAEWNPQTWRLDALSRREVRWQVARARNKKVKAGFVGWQDLVAGAPLRHDAERVLRAWLGTRAMASLGFMARPEPFADLKQRRFSVARVGDKVVGFVSVIPHTAPDGWYLEHVIRAPDAPNGTTELLIDHVFSQAKAEGVTYATLGLAPLAGCSDAADVPAWARTLFRFSYGKLSSLYNFEGLYRFKSKFVPDRWAPMYLLCTPRFSPRHLWAALAAFADGTPLSFATRSALRVIGRKALRQRRSSVAHLT